MSHLSRQTHVERPDSRDEGRDDEWEDEGLEHPEEQVADVGDVHDLAVGPSLWKKNIKLEVSHFVIGGVFVFFRIWWSHIQDKLIL